MPAQVGAAFRDDDEDVVEQCVVETVERCDRPNTPARDRNLAGIGDSKTLVSRHGPAPCGLHLQLEIAVRARARNGSRNRRQTLSDA
jgi:hypothetical protein